MSRDRLCQPADYCVLFTCIVRMLSTVIQNELMAGSHAVDWNWRLVLFIQSQKKIFLNLYFNEMLRNSSILRIDNRKWTKSKNDMMEIVLNEIWEFLLYRSTISYAFRTNLCTMYLYSLLCNTQKFESIHLGTNWKW